MKSVRKIIKEMVEKYPNDMELGARVRWYIRWLYGEEKENPKNNSNKKKSNQTRTQKFNERIRPHNFTDKN